LLECGSYTWTQKSRPLTLVWPRSRHINFYVFIKWRFGRISCILYLWLLKPLGLILCVFGTIKHNIKTLCCQLVRFPTLKFGKIVEFRCLCAFVHILFSRTWDVSKLIVYHQNRPKQSTISSYITSDRNRANIHDSLDVIVFCLFRRFCIHMCRNTHIGCIGHTYGHIDRNVF
jgi:hypothetical protein